ncbi:glycoside hydrolase family 88/105 protein [Alkalitalea saponilacus]|uniref:Unsaturated rhamnogalacturonyl hydrolase n=1 Tax=Alkalitalea saponilacus TaxID=889453 RepID=A0A1T5ER76_9BACT|nr:glycoside hydrolase family 88 protein [Alkalitalea saponilacus]ASB48052.1 glycosyl hydrolase family 88 [Alkalitalea saponilacus]SKB86415.1 unsaturated rhamnogalacturonyl hydrolase [Alkalitalea saponilacus]
MKKTSLIISAILVFMLGTSCSNSSTNELYWAEKMAQSDMKRNPEGWMIDFRQTPKWEYTHGLMMTALMELYKETGDEQYLEYIQGFADKFISPGGEILTYKLTDYNIDRINPGKFMIELYQLTGDQKLLDAIELLREQMRHHPRTSEGGFWHKKVYPHQMWLDGLYMGAPFLAQYAHTFNEPELFADVAHQFYLVDKNMYDPAVGLYYHAWDERREQRWADPETGLSPGFWGRALGWYAMGIVDATAWFPKDHTGRQNLIRLVNRLAEGVVQYQNPETGLWSQVPNQPDREGNYEEATASAMLTYFLLKSVRLGYLDSHYLEYAKRGYQGILDNLIREDEDGTISLESCCEVAGLGGNPFRDGSFEYYISEPIRDNDPKGVGPFILASIEMTYINQK